MLSETSKRELVAVVGGRAAWTDPADLALYAYDATHYTRTPAIVLAPACTAEVAAIMTIASRERVPVVARGAGTSLSGSATPAEGGIVISTARLNRILAIDAASMSATVEPGVVAADFMRAVESQGLFYPPDPSSQSVSTLGGNVAQGAGGPRGAKYGTTKDYVVGLEAVLADGTVLHCSVDDDYDLIHLLVGSEGTLAVITKITVRLLPLPEAKQTALAIFDSFEAAAEAVAAIIAAKIIPTTLELMDNFVVRKVQSYRPVGLPEDAEGVLLMEVDGYGAEVAEQVEEIAAIAKRCGASTVKVARNRAENDDLWAARRAAYAALARSRPTAVAEDATVPRSQLPAIVRTIKHLAEKYKLEVPVLAHAGDGNTHPIVLCDWRDGDEMARVERFAGELFRATVEMGGTLSGEHGIGLVKQGYMEWQHGAEGIAAMRRVKQAFDPNDLLNPGKVLPT
ncbi:MAG: FAD-binding oxidoreductase [Chloroflexota bacterium]